MSNIIPKTMATNHIQAIILAAGKSSRFNTDKTKLSYTLCGQEMIVYPVKLLNRLSIPTTIVVGHQKEIIKEVLDNYNFKSLDYCKQEIQQGTGDAVLCTRDRWFADNILIINGDMPLVTPEIIESLITEHLTHKAAISFITAHNPDPHTAYGRVIEENKIVEIIEAKEFKGDPNKHCCINAGIYLIKKSFLEKAVTTLQKSSVTSEFYITDLVKKASESKQPVKTISVPLDTIRGINTMKELWIAEQIKRSEIIEHFMNNGVRFINAQTVHLDLNVSIDSGTTIGPNVQIINGSHVGKNCIIGAGSLISNSKIYNNVTINPYTLIYNSKIKHKAKVGPFAHIRNKSILEKESVIGNFVEVSQSIIGQSTKAKHLSYIGYAELGKEVNIGAGSITCNYNGVTKNKTEIKDNVFIGSNSALVAPVSIEKNAIVAAGSVITENVLEDSLAIARSRQITKPNYVTLLKQKYHKHKEKLQEKS